MASSEYESIILERKERPGDRSRSRLSLPRENPRKEFADGMVRIKLNHNASVIVAKRYGFRVVDAGARKRVPAPAPATVPPSRPPAPEPASDRRAELEAMSKASRKRLAKELEIAGRSKMDDDELIAAIFAAE